MSRLWTSLAEDMEAGRPARLTLRKCRPIVRRTALRLDCTAYRNRQMLLRQAAFILVGLLLVAGRGWAQAADIIFERRPDGTLPTPRTGYHLGKDQGGGFVAIESVDGRIVPWQVRLILRG